MKKTIKIVAASVFAAILLLTSCGGGASAPKDVTVKFLEATTKADFKEANKYASEETIKMLDMIKAFASMKPDSVKNKKVEIEVIEEKIDGDNATVRYKQNGKENAIKLVKIDGNWKVNISKADMGGGSEDAMKDPVPLEDGVNSDVGSDSSGH